MAKKYGFDPFILLTMDMPQPTTVTGGGSGQGGHTPYACTYSDWLNLFAVDYDNNGFDENDYRTWFQSLFADDHEEGQEMWELYGNEGDLFTGADEP